MSNAESATKPLQRTGHVATSYKNGVLVWGGYRVGSSEEDHLRRRRFPQQAAETERSTRYLPGNELWFYDTFLERWTPRNLTGDVPPGTSGAVARVLGDTMYLFGGFHADRNTNQLYRLDLTTLTWELVDAQGNLPIPCDKTAGWTHQDCLYVFGGFGMVPRAGVQRPLDFAYVHDMQAPWRGWTNQLVVFNTHTNTWNWPMYKGRAPVARAAHAAAQIENLVFIFGGRHQQSRLNDIHRLDLDAMQWSGTLDTVGEKPRGRSWHSFTALPPFRVVLYGGFSQTEEPLSDCWLFVVPALTWVRVELQLPPRLWHSACLSCENEVIVFGGCAGNIFQRGGIHAEDTIITLSFSPRSLYRICLEQVLRLRHLLQSQWPTLPPSVRDTLYLMHGNTQGSRLDGS
ncbi:kelch domain-containing protein 2-like isoform X1 [Dermacentor albipictus]|uniref:kelch domain-containing protein 2-like isoform X1 n=1 Tax=Dermacentor albipictus TaxID=60249 RepID=UPI0031FE1114